MKHREPLIEIGFLYVSLYFVPTLSGERTLQSVFDTQAGCSFNKVELLICLEIRFADRYSSDMLGENQE
jgi:hypothetical protein